MIAIGAERPSKEENVSAFFREGRCVWAMCDGGAGWRAAPLPPDPEAALRAVGTQADGVIAGLGLWQAIGGSIEGPGAALRADICGRAAPERGKPAGDRAESSFIVHSVDDALAAGAHGLLARIVIGHPDEPWMLRDLGVMTGAAVDAGAAVFAEALVEGADRPEAQRAAAIARAVRIAGELGADAVATPLPVDAQDAATLRGIVRQCWAPVIFCEGERPIADPLALTRAADAAARAGAGGLALSPARWGSPDGGARAASAICEVIHGGANPKSAAEILRSETF